jgi:hypothetical protein
MYLDGTLLQVLGYLSNEQYKKMIMVLSTNSNLVQKHKELFGALKWQDWTLTKVNLVQACAWDINPGIRKGRANSLLSLHIYVDNILAAAAFRETMLRLLASIIKAIFLICGVPDIAIRQCPLLLKKWSKLIVGPRQVIERICPSGGSISRIWSRFGVGVRSFSWNRSVRNGGVLGESSTYFREASCRLSTGREWDWHVPDTC